MPTPKTLLITGATGKQGGAVIAALAGKGFTLHAMTRKPTARPLGPWPHPASRSFKATWTMPAHCARRSRASGVSSRSRTPWEAGVEKEEEQGKRIATLAREVGVEHFVYSSVGSAHRATGIPHFENKWRVEQTVRALSFPSYVILRPVFFMENMTSPWSLNGDKLYAGLRPETVLQMIAVHNIGEYGARAFTDAARLKGREMIWREMRSPCRRPPKR